MLAVVARRSKRFTSDRCHAIRSEPRGAPARAASADSSRLSGLMADVMARASGHLQAQHRTRVAHLIESNAFADATLALLELERPQWKLRRLIYEDGEWHCSLSKHIGLPAELDDEMAEASHESLPLAILSAFVEAGRHSLVAGEGRPRSVPLRFVPHRVTPFVATISRDEAIRGIARSSSDASSDNYAGIATRNPAWV